MRSTTPALPSERPPLLAVLFRITLICLCLAPQDGVRTGAERGKGMPQTAQTG